MDGRLSESASIILSLCHHHLQHLCAFPSAGNLLHMTTSARWPLCSLSPDTASHRVLKGNQSYGSLKTERNLNTHLRIRRGDRRYSSYSFMASALDQGEWSESFPCRALAPGKGPSVRIIQEAGWAPESRGKIPSPRPEIEPRSPGRPVRSLILYWLSYPSSLWFTNLPILT
jgi:hypothetical protein